MTKQFAVKRLMVLLSNCIIMLFCGLLFAWTIFVSPLEAEFGWTRAQTTLTFSLSIVVSTTAAWLASIAAHKIGARRVVLASAVICALGLILASRLNSLAELYIYYGCISAFAIGMVYNLALSTANMWFPDRAGVVSGVVLMLFGFGGMVCGSFASFLITRFSWRTAFLVLGLAGFFIMVLCSLNICEPSKKYAAQLAALAKPREVSAPHRNYSTGQMARTKTFWLMEIWYIALAAIGLTTSSHSAQIASSIGIASAAGYASVVMVTNGIARLITGRIIDIRGKNTAIVLMAGTAAAGTAVLIGAVAAESAPLLMAAYILLGLSYGAGPTTFVALVREFFGEENYGINIGCANMSLLVSSVAGPYISGVIYQRSGYISIACMLFGCAVAGILLIRPVLKNDAE